ncbi:MAG: DUF305 domain-containing protein [Methylorubrum rhodinum]|jgi:uncharacterized protein (DUF305 family)|uniref:DUF305 domain-containing protein n=1 Tax=Methylorubrum rhodinum TaxID=29428 RepID=UPI003BAF439B
MNIIKATLVVTVAMALGTTASIAQQGQGGSMLDMKGMSSMDMKSMGPLQKSSMEAMDRMNKAMMQGLMDQDPDLAWMKSMAAHHQGAIDMAEAAIKNAKDEDVLKEARKTKEENEKSLKQLQAKIKKEK